MAQTGDRDEDYSLDDMDEFEPIHDDDAWRHDDDPELIEPLGIPAGGHGRLRAVSWSLLGAAMAVLLLCCGAWALNMWDHHWRSIPVDVNGNARMIRADTSLGKLMRDNGDFGVRPGRLLSISGALIRARGGGPVTCSVNGERVPSGRVDDTTLPVGAAVTLASGSDVTEGHAVRHVAIPFKVVMNGRGVIQMVTQHGSDGMREIWIGNRSHERVDKGVIAQPKDLIVTSIGPRPQGKKVIALTFDDGPGPFSAPILDILKQKGVKATFFDVGQNALQYPKAEQRMLAEGNEVASHSNTHPDMTKLSADAMRQDIRQGLANIRQASGATTKVFRAPYGAFTAAQWLHAADLIDCNVLWSVDTEDWRRPGADRIHDEVLKNAYNGAVVIMHDGGGDRAQDVAALPRIIDDLKAGGYTFVTIQELIDMNR